MTNNQHGEDGNAQILQLRAVEEHRHVAGTLGLPERELHLTDAPCGATGRPASSWATSICS